MTENTYNFTYIVFSQHMDHPIHPSDTGSIKGFANNLVSARLLAQQIIKNEYQLDKVPIHCAIIRYNNGVLSEAVWTLDCFEESSTNSFVTGYVIRNGVCQESDVHIDDLNSRVSLTKEESGQQPDHLGTGWGSPDMRTQAGDDLEESLLKISKNNAPSGADGADESKGWEQESRRKEESSEESLQKITCNVM